MFVSLFALSSTDVLDRGHTDPVQALHSGCRRLHSARGFTLIELMVALVIVTLLGALAFGGFRQNEARGAYARFVEDLHGGLVTARNAAIDEQARVRVLITAAGLRIQQFDPATEQWIFLRLAARDAGRGEGPQTTGDAACVMAVQAAISTPSQARNVEVPVGCLAGSVTLTFEPDGRFQTQVQAFDNAGMTVWVGDRRMGTETQYSVIQVFPGGYTRVFNDVGVRS